MALERDKTMSRGTARLERSGPGWSNVAEWLEDIRSTYGVKVFVELWPAQYVDNTPFLVVCITSYTRVDGHGTHEYLQTSERWPNRNWFSMEALLCNMAHRHCKAIEAERDKPLEARRRPLPEAALPS